jgi:hypothetical protein
LSLEEDPMKEIMVASLLEVSGTNIRVPGEKS